SARSSAWEEEATEEDSGSISALSVDRAVLSAAGVSSDTFSPSARRMARNSTIKAIPRVRPFFRRDFLFFLGCDLLLSMGRSAICRPVLKGLAGAVLVGMGSVFTASGGGVSSLLPQ